MTPLRVLLVEDSETDARLVVHALEQAGFAPSWRRVETEAELVSALEGPLDLVLADYSLPGWNALAALAAVRERRLDVPFIVVSGAMGEEAAVEAMRMGADDYLLKDRLARLGGAVLHAIETHRLRAETRAADRALRDAERRHRSLLERSWDGIMLYASDGSVVSSSTTGQRVLGYEPEEVAGMQVLSFVHPDDQARVAAVLSGPIGSDGASVTARVRHKDGSYRDLEGMCSNLLADPAVGAIVVNYRDVTERNRTAAELRRTEERFRAFMTNTPMGACLLDVAGRVLYVNPAWERAFMDASDAVGRLASEIVPLPQARELEEAQRRVMSSGTAEELELELPCRAGLPRRWHAFCFPVLQSSGDTLFGCIALDVTERERARAVLEAAELRLRHAVIAGNVGLWDWDLATNEVHYSLEWKRQIGYDDGEIGTGLDEWSGRVHPEDFPKALAALNAYIGGDSQLYEVEFRFRHKDGSYRNILSRGSRMVGAGGEPRRMLGSHVDVTTRNELQLQLVQAQKMESLGRLAGGIAHDFNNLITVINSLSEIVMGELQPSDPLRADLRDIHDAGERAAALTRQLLAFSRKQILAPEIVQLGPLAEQLSGMLRRLIGEHLTLNVIAKDRGWVKADPGQIEQVIVNLVVNARDAFTDGGTVTIETADVTLDDKPAVRLSVRDDGTGMDAATLARVFEPFFTTKPPGQGTGLGLSTVHGIVTQSGGKISVRSQLGAGTTFDIDLPSVDARRAQQQSEAPVERARGRGTILVVEDEPSIRRLAQRILQSSGYTVLTAGSGAEALTLFEMQPSSIDLLLTDVVMPGISGRELADRVRVSRPEVRVLYSSGYTDDDILRRGVLTEEHAFLAKPYTPDELRARVAQLLERERV